MFALPPVWIPDFTYIKNFTIMLSESYRYLINSIYKNQNKEPPNIIKSPSFPILLTYELSNFEIYHYDLYRVSKNSELIHLNIFEELNNSITLVEWPETILDSLQNYNYFSIHFVKYHLSNSLCLVLFFFGLMPLSLKNSSHAIFAPGYLKEKYSSK